MKRRTESGQFLVTLFTKALLDTNPLWRVEPLRKKRIGGLNIEESKINA